MHSLRGSEPTALEAVGYVTVVQVRLRNDDSTLGKLSRVLSRIREILHYFLLVRILESINFTHEPLPFVDQLKCTLVTKLTVKF